ncbi:unnamed protein product [Diabrotica balteata]|uniref:CRAL-TRIO domain-containing protein n=1 Tax=Diabrotica balteata TaxID=107213 RepID=A0A9N9XCV9_DIABA|nr:unnamed protein product [Diabrotica balteata]
MDFLLKSAICLPSTVSMDTKKWLTWNQDEALGRALKRYGKTLKQLEGDIQTIKDWMKTQHHLPELGSDGLIKNFLLGNKLSIEQTKEKVDMYYTIRHMMPEVYDHSNINKPQMKKIADQLYFFPLPKRTEEGSRVTVCKLMDTSSDNFDFYKFLAYGCSNMEVRFQEDLLYDEIIVIDLENVKMGHIFKSSPFHLKKMLTILEKVYSNKLKKIHMVNCPTFAVNTINALKQLIKPKLASRIFVHEGTETLSNHISVKVLPGDYHGLELSLQELNEMWKIKLQDHKDRFDVLDNLRTNESLRPSALQNDEILGYHGNFRKLSLD